jgi:hypothetical protein
LRARGQFTELRAANLRFTVEEATRLLRDNLQLPLDDRAIARLRTRTEGWSAGAERNSERCSCRRSGDHAVCHAGWTAGALAVRSRIYQHGAPV